MFKTQINYIKLILLSLILFPIIIANSQTIYKYRVDLTDKNNSPYNIYNPSEFLSPKAIERRLNQGIEITEQDIPVNKNYLLQLISKGVNIQNYSRWFNSVVVFTQDSSLKDTLLKLPFVENISLIAKTEKIKSSINIKINIDTASMGKSYNQLNIIELDELHKKGFMGENIDIAIIDAGFLNVNETLSLKHLFDNNKILGTKDFVDLNNDIYKESVHGLAVFTVLGSYMPNKIIGSAPNANYWLLRSENEFYEQIEEEENWIAAVEFADSVGADIISSSLGYTTFDIASQNHTYQDLDGKTTRISISADIAFEKGMIVVNSVGNSGNKDWKYLGAPADAKNIIAVGSVNSDREISDFSSFGPTSDNRIKPDVLAMGDNTAYYNYNDEIKFTGGTSMSAPLISGAIACLWQALPLMSNKEIIDLTKQSTHLFNNPNNHEGYGIPNFYKAYLTQLNYTFNNLESNDFEIYPNPFFEKIEIYYKADEYKNIEICIFDVYGKYILSENIVLSNSTLSKFSINTSSLNNGVYILRIFDGENYYKKKIIKI